MNWQNGGKARVLEEAREVFSETVIEYAYNPRNVNSVTRTGSGIFLMIS